MSFRVPEKYRITTGRAASSALNGNNGAFVIPCPHPLAKQPMYVIASDGEEWLPIKGYETLYMVSTLGRVRALQKDVHLPNGGVRSHGLAILSQEVTEKGYLRVSLNSAGECERRLVHVLVAEAFISSKDGFTQVNHLDGKKDNNCVDNLEWCTPEYNSHHAIECGLRTGIKAEDIEQIKAMFDSGMATKDVAVALGMSRQSACDIKSGRHRNLFPEQPIRWKGAPHWEHVSVSLKSRTPTWAEMCWIKLMFWSGDDTVLQFHPPESEYVNNHEHRLHLWKPVGTSILRPPQWMV